MEVLEKKRKMIHFICIHTNTHWSLIDFFLLFKAFQFTGQVNICMISSGDTLYKVNMEVRSNDEAALQNIEKNRKDTHTHAICKQIVYR